MKRTAGTLVLHSLLPIGTNKVKVFCTLLCFAVYFLGYAYLSVVMDYSHPSMASFWEVRTIFVQNHLLLTSSVQNFTFSSRKESPWFYQATLISLLLPISALTLLWFVF